MISNVKFVRQIEDYGNSVRLGVQFKKDGVWVRFSKRIKTPRHGIKIARALQKVVLNNFKGRV